MLLGDKSLSAGKPHFYPFTAIGRCRAVGKFAPLLKFREGGFAKFRHLTVQDYQANVSNSGS